MNWDADEHRLTGYFYCLKPTPTNELEKLKNGKWEIIQLFSYSTIQLGFEESIILPWIYTDKHGFFCCF